MKSKALTLAAFSKAEVLDSNVVIIFFNRVIVIDNKEKVGIYILSITIIHNSSKG